MTAIACAVLTAIGFFFSIGLGEEWWLAWLAPIPVLWFGFGETRTWQAFLAAWVGYALGGANLLQAYAGVLPAPVLVLGIAGPALLFAVAVLGGAIATRRIGPLAGALTFATLWAAFDFLISFNKAGGAVSTPAISQVFMPVLAQSASLVGAWGITFLLSFVPAGIAASLRTRTALPAIVAVAVFAANAAFGYLRIAPPSETIHTALINTDAMQKATDSNNEMDTRAVIDAYVRTIHGLTDDRIKLIVLPEKIAIVRAEWQGEAKRKLAEAARARGAVLVAGFDSRSGKDAFNESWAFTPPAPRPTVYTKRQLVPGLETEYTIGRGPVVLADGTGLEICKDMDFQAMIRTDMVATTPRFLAVPAWDFGADGSMHARAAILRSIENGVPMARTARNGLLTLNDRYGRVVAVQVTRGPDFNVLIGDLPLDGRGGGTLYDKIGDAFGWLCLALGLGLTGFALFQRKRAA